MKTLVIGELNVDLIFNGFSSFPAIGQEVWAKEMNMTLGSSSAIFAVNLSNLGNPVAFYGGLGSDYYGEFILEILQKYKVNTDRIIQYPHGQTGTTLILNAKEDRANVTFPGVMHEFSPNDIDDELLSQYQHLHFSSYFFQPQLQSLIPQFFERAKFNGLTTSFDMQWDPLEQWNIDLPSILPYVDLFLPNELEFIHAFHSSSYAEALQQLRRTNFNHCIVKQGNKGSTLITPQEITAIPTYLNTNVVDAIGAGDSFNAGLIHSFLRKQPLHQCLQYASLIAAISTTKSGGINALADQAYRIRTAKERFNQNLS